MQHLAAIAQPGLLGRQRRSAMGPPLKPAQAPSLAVGAGLLSSPGNGW